MQPLDPGPIRTLRFKVRSEAYAWLNAAAIEVNRVWNYLNETSYRAVRNYVGRSHWLTGEELCALTRGATHEFECIGADTIQRLCMEYPQKRLAARRAKLRWRVSSGSRRSRGYVPFKAASIRRHGKALRFCGKPIRVFEGERFERIAQWQQGCFSQDGIGDWYLCLPVHVQDETPYPTDVSVGIDLGLKCTAVSSDNHRCPAGVFYRSLEQKIAQAQRRGHQRQARRLHRRAQRRRHNAHHVFSRTIVSRYQYIFIGDVSALALIRTPFAKAVLDSGWASLTRQLQYKGTQAGRVVQIVNERNTSRTCSACGALSGPQGVNGLRVRTWICGGCGAAHDRDVNAAINIRSVGGSSHPCGNEYRCEEPPPSRAYRPREAGTARLAAAL